MLEGASDRLTSMPESLKEKTVRGTIWSGIDSIAGQGISFLVGLVLARLLSPQEYGLIGYILIIVAILNSIVDSGFSNALIRKKDPGEEGHHRVPEAPPDKLPQQEQNNALQYPAFEHRSLRNHLQNVIAIH